MRYVLARAAEKRRTMMYRVYVTDALKVISASAAGASREGGYAMAERWADMVYTTTEPEEDDPRTCVEIVADMWTRLREGGDAE